MPNFVEVNINDPNVPVIINEEIKAMPGAVVVTGFTGESGEKGSITFQAAGVHVAIASALNFVKNKKNLPKWARTNTLVAIPRAGTQFNAYYDGGTLRFFHNKHPITGLMVYACESSDIIVHELGHAILDTWRPDLWSTICVEAISFHEAFGDILSMLVALSYEQMIDYVLNETSNDISKSNAVSRIAEQLGSAVRTGETYLRDAVNSFTYVPPEHLPIRGHHTQLLREPHSYSRLFTGAFYDVFVMLFRKFSEKMTPKEAVGKARDLAADLLFKAIPRSPNNARFYRSVAVYMVHAAEENLREDISNVFRSRGIMNGFSMDFVDDEPVGSTKSVKVSDYVKSFSADNPLFDVKVDIPNDSLNDGKFKYTVNESIDAARVCLEYLDATDSVAFNGENKEYSVVDGKLVRNFICCC